MLLELWNIAGNFDFKEILLDENLYLELNFDIILELLQKRRNLYICCEDIIVAKLFKYFERNYKLPKIFLFNTILNPNIVNMGAVSSSFWTNLADDEDKDVSHFAKMMLKLKRSIEDFSNSPDIESFIFTGSITRCTCCNKQSLLSFKIGEIWCCERCWAEYSNSYIFNLSKFSYKTKQKALKPQKLKTRTNRLESRKELERSRKGTMLSFTSTDMRSTYQRSKISTKIFQTNGSGVAPVSTRTLSELDFSLGSKLNRNYSCLSQKLLKAHQQRYFLKPGVYTLHQYKGVACMQSKVEFFVSGEGHALGFGEDSKGRYIFKGKCYSPDFTLTKTYSLDESQERFSFIENRWENLGKNKRARTNPEYFKNIFFIEKFIHKESQVRKEELKKREEKPLELNFDTDTFYLSMGKKFLVNTNKVNTLTSESEPRKYRNKIRKSCTICMKEVNATEAKSKLCYTCSEEYKKVNVLIEDKRNKIKYESEAFLVSLDIVIIQTKSPIEKFVLIHYKKERHLLHYKSKEFRIYKIDKIATPSIARTSLLSRTCINCKDLSLTESNCLDLLKYSYNKGLAELKFVVEQFLLSSLEKVFGWYTETVGDTSFLLTIFNISPTFCIEIYQAIDNNPTKYMLKKEISALSNSLETICMDLLIKCKKENLLKVVCIVALMCTLKDEANISFWTHFPTKTKNYVHDALLEFFQPATNKTLDSPEPYVGKDCYLLFGSFVSSFLATLNNSKDLALVKALRKIIPSISNTPKVRLVLAVYKTSSKDLMKSLKVYDNLFAFVSRYILYQVIAIKVTGALFDEEDEVMCDILDCYEKTIKQSSALLPLKNKSITACRTTLISCLNEFGYKISEFHFRKKFEKQMTPSFASFCLMLLYLKQRRNEKDVAYKSLLKSFSKICSFLLLDQFSLKRSLMKLVSDYLLPSIILLINNVITLPYVIDFSVIVKKVFDNASKHKDLKTSLSSLKSIFLSNLYYQLKLNGSEQDTENIKITNFISWLPTLTSIMCHLAQPEFISLLKEIDIDKKSNLYYFISVFPSHFHEYTEALLDLGKKKKNYVFLCSQIMEALGEKYLRRKRNKRKNTKVTFAMDPEERPTLNRPSLIVPEIKFLGTMCEENKSFCALLEKILIPIYEFSEVKKENKQQCTRLLLYYSLSQLLRCYSLDKLGFITSNNEVSLFVLLVFDCALKSIDTATDYIVVKGILEMCLAFVIRIQADCLEKKKSLGTLDEDEDAARKVRRKHEKLTTELTKTLEIVIENVFSRLCMLTNIKHPITKSLEESTRYSEFVYLTDTLIKLMKTGSSLKNFTVFLGSFESMLSLLVTRIEETITDDIILFDLILVLLNNVQIIIESFNLKQSNNIISILDDGIIESLSHILEILLSVDDILLKNRYLEMLKLTTKEKQSKLLKDKRLAKERRVEVATDSLLIELLFFFIFLYKQAPSRVWRKKKSYINSFTKMLTNTRKLAFAEVSLADISCTFLSKALSHVHGTLKPEKTIEIVNLILFRLSKGNVEVQVILGYLILLTSLSEQNCLTPFIMSEILSFVRNTVSEEDNVIEKIKRYFRLDKVLVENILLLYFHYSLTLVSSYLDGIEFDLDKTELLWILALLNKVTENIDFSSDFKPSIQKKKPSKKSIVIKSRVDRMNSAVSGTVSEISTSTFQENLFVNQTSIGRLSIKIIERLEVLGYAEEVKDIKEKQPKFTEKKIVDNTEEDDVFAKVFGIKFNP